MNFLALAGDNTTDPFHTDRTRFAAKPIAFGRAVITSHAAFSCNGIACTAILTALFSTMYRTGEFTLILHADAIAFTRRIADFRTVDTPRIGTNLFFGTPRFANIGNRIYQIDTFSVFALLFWSAFIIAGIRRLGVWFLIVRIVHTLSGIGYF